MKERDLCIDCEDGFKDEKGLCVEDTGPDMSHKLVQCPAEERFDNCNICAEANVQVGEDWYDVVMLTFCDGCRNPFPTPTPISK